MDDRSREAESGDRSIPLAGSLDILDASGFFCEVIANASPGIVVIDTDLVVVYANERAGDLLERTPDGLVEQPLSSIVHDQPELVERAIRVALEEDIAGWEGETLVLPGAARGSGWIDMEVRTISHRGEQFAVAALTEGSRRGGQGTEELTRQVAQLEWINDLIRGIDRALIPAGTRQEIAEAVCDRLVQGDRVSFAAIGDVDPAGGTIDIVAFVGDGVAFLENGPIDLRGSIPAARAARTRESEYVPDVADIAESEQWREAALARGIRSILSVPMVYDDVTYGVLVVAASRPSAFDEQLRTIVREVSETVASAMNSVVAKRSLRVDTGLELTFRLVDGDDPIQWLSDRTGSTLAVEVVLPRAKGSSKALLTAEGGDPTGFTALEGEHPEIESIRVVAERSDVTVIEALITGETVETILVEHGAAISSMRVDEHGLEVTAEVPLDADVRGITERIRRRYPDAEMARRRRLERPIRTKTGFWSEFEDRLTERQREILRVAYLSGYFDWPREHTGEEIAGSLGISGPALNRLLRRGQKKLLDLLYEDQ